jgi:hypothetical protein
MTNPTIDPDRHRGMAAQKATELRRLMATVAADAEALRERQNDLESQLPPLLQRAGSMLRNKRVICWVFS